MLQQQLIVLEGCFFIFVIHEYIYSIQPPTCLIYIDIVFGIGELDFQNCLQGQKMEIVLNTRPTPPSMWRSSYYASIVSQTGFHHHSHSNIPWQCYPLYRIGQRYRGRHRIS